MERLFAPEYWIFWAAALALALYWPVRHLIWVLQVRRLEAKSGRRSDDAERARLRARSGFTAALLCLVFSLLYMHYLFAGEP